MRRLMLALLCVSGVAEAKTCKVTGNMVTYYRPRSGTKTDAGTKTKTKMDTRCTMTKDRCNIELKGMLYLPSGNGPHPLLVFNHASNQPVPDACELAEYFVPLGYVLFVPHRRGHGASTGVYFDEYTKDYCSTPGDDGACKMEYLHKQVDDVEEAIKYAKGVKGDDGNAVVDPDKIALMGHSFGGIVSVFANARDMGQRAVLDSSGASQSWEKNENARKEMKEAVKQAVAPIFFFEVMNDVSIGPTIELSRVAEDNCRLMQATLYPAIDTDGDGEITDDDYTFDARNKAHGSHAKNPKGEYGADAQAFMNRYFAKPGKNDKRCRGTSNQ